MSSENMYVDDEPDDIIILHCDIRMPLRILRTMIERKIGVLLEGYSFWLQDAQELESHKNLVDQCVKGEGLVQINVQIQTINKRINIVDVLKPTEAALAALTFEETNDLIRTTDIITENLEKNKERKSERSKPNWVQDKNFKEEQIRLNIPEDPNEWNISQVKFWLNWAIKEFDLEDVSIKDFNLSGRELCALTHIEFQKKIAKDPGHLFWTHLQLLKESKFVSVMDDIAELDKNYNIVESQESDSKKELKIMRKSFQKGLPLTQNHSLPYNSCYIVGSGNNGQIQLWQFLLDLLTDRQHRTIIQWVGDEGEFKLIDPECVARLWGEKKNKPAMNYEKLSRALRYYYDGDMISKVSGKRFAYKFDCDLHLLIGYNAAELSKLVNENPISDEVITPDYVKFPSDIE